MKEFLWLFRLNWINIILNRFICELCHRKMPRKYATYAEHLFDYHKDDIDSILDIIARG